MLEKNILPIDYRYIKNKKNLFIGRVEIGVASLIPSGEELYDMVL